MRLTRALAGMALAMFTLAGCGWVEAARLLDGIARGAPEGEVRREIGEKADLYAAAAPPLAGIVLLPGVSPQGRDDPRLVGFARALAAQRFAVLVPELPELRALRVSASDAEAVVAAVHRLRGRGLRVGVGAFSYAVGPALLAGLELGPDAAFVLAIGGYRDIANVIRHFTAGPADRRAKWLFLRANASRLDRPAEQQALAVMANRRLADEQAGIADLMGDLGPDGRAVAALVTNRDPGAVEALLKGLPSPIRRELEALDLSRRDLGALEAPLLLVHGRGDPVIPAEESVALAAAAPNSELFLLQDLSHVDAGWTLRDGLTMLRAARSLLRLRDGEGF